MQLIDLIVHWTPWAVATLLVIALLISAIQPHTIAQSLQVLSSPIQRRYTKGGNPPLLFLLRMLFQLGTITLGLLLATAAFTGTTPQAMHYLVSAGIVLAVMMLKGVIDKWIQLTFCYAVNEKTYYAYRSELWQVMSMAIWLVLLFSPILPPTAIWAAMAGILVMYWGVLWWKIMQVFGWTIEHMVFSLVYILHLEVLPIAAIVGGIGLKIDD